MTSAGDVSQTGQGDSKHDQRQIACHRLLGANATRRHCLRKVMQQEQKVREKRANIPSMILLRFHLFERLAALHRKMKLTVPPSLFILLTKVSVQ